MNKRWISDRRWTNLLMVLWLLLLLLLREIYGCFRFCCDCKLSFVLIDLSGRMILELVGFGASLLLHWDGGVQDRNVRSRWRKKWDDDKREKRWCKTASYIRSFRATDCPFRSSRKQKTPDPISNESGLFDGQRWNWISISNFFKSFHFVTYKI